MKILLSKIEEEVDAEFEINNDFHVFGYNIVPDVVYRRALTPRIPYDCKNRDEEFYSRDDILILWEPQEIIRLAFEDNRGSSYPMEYVIRQVPWQRIKQPISEVPDLIRDEIVVVGCFTDKDNIYFGKIPFILAKYVGFAIRNIERYCGYRLYANAFWDESTKRYLISEFHFSASFMPYLERIPGGNGNLRTTVEKSSKVGKFYKIRQNRGAYIFDRFNLVQEHIPEDFEYPIKIIKNPFYEGYTVLEIAAPDEIEPPKEWIEGQFFVATEEYLYSSEYEDAIIWYNKKNFDMECGYFYRVEAKYNDSKKRYEVYSVNFFDMDESFLEPIKTCGKICYLIRAAIEDGFIIHQIFGNIGFKPFRNIEADEPLT
uniref:Uncharacterized protein n=1 Tax=Panagrolaimus superbus TaxID=310955 RepID=A0A914Z040_9BILA